MADCHQISHEARQLDRFRLLRHVQWKSHAFSEPALGGTPQVYQDRINAVDPLLFPGLALSTQYLAAPLESSARSLLIQWYQRSDHRRIPAPSVGVLLTLT